MKFFRRCACLNTVFDKTGNKARSDPADGRAVRTNTQQTTENNASNLDTWYLKIAVAIAAYGGLIANVVWVYQDIKRRGW